MECAVIGGNNRGGAILESENRAPRANGACERDEAVRGKKYMEAGKTKEIEREGRNGTNTMTIAEKVT